jgi:hypothetical protein
MPFGAKHVRPFMGYWIIPRLPTQAGVPVPVACSMGMELTGRQNKTRELRQKHGDKKCFFNSERILHLRCSKF